jgi:hypothetical protein
MNHVPVKSSTIKSVAYDAATKTMQVRFHSGGLYEYSPVEPHEHARFMLSPSKGKHFHHHVKSKFNSTKLEAADSYGTARFRSDDDNL